MKFDLKSNFMSMVLSLILVVLLSSYLGTYMKEGFEDDDYMPGEDGPFEGPQIPDEYQKPDGMSQEDWDRIQNEEDEDEEWDELVEKVEKLDGIVDKVNKVKSDQSIIRSDLNDTTDRIKDEAEIKRIAESEIAAKGFVNKNFVTSFFDQTGVSQDLSKLQKRVSGLNIPDSADIVAARTAAATAQGAAEEAKAQAMAAMNKIPPKPDLSGLQPKGEYATKGDLSRLQPKGEYATAGDYATKADLSTLKFQAPGDYATTAQLGGYVTQDDLKSKLESQTKGNYATQDQLNDLRNEFNNKFLKHGDEITLRSRRSGRRLQDRGYGRYANSNRMWWERMHIEKCGQPGMYDNKQCR